MFLHRCAVALVCGVMAASAAAQELKVEKVDPPNWWAQMPAPMLLVKGEGLKAATVTLSDRSLQVQRLVPSENGHWLQVWLTAAPKAPETVTLHFRNGSEQAEAKYVFEARKAAGEGFAGFNAQDVMYLIMTDRFADGDRHNDGAEANAAEDSAAAGEQRALPRGWHGGDLRGVEQHLDYLQQLGMTAVWTTPVYQNHEADSYHGYGATDMYAVDEHYGSLQDLRSLAQSLHRRGMKLVLDTVPNHVGPAHPWVKDEPAPDWLHGTPADHEEGENDFRSLMSPHASDRDRRATLTGWFANTLPDLNTESPAVAQYLRQNAIWWIEQTGADALRIDTFPYVDRAFWNGFNGELKELYPRLTEVGETFSPDPVFVSSYAGGVTRTGVDTRLYTPFDFPTYFAVRETFLKGGSMLKLDDVLADDSLYPHAERLTVFLGNHDTSRFREEAASDAVMKLALGYIFTTRGMPQLYSGDELAMRGKDDPDNRRDFPGGFAGESAGNNAFVAAERTPEQQGMHDWVATLTRLRKEHPALACGGLQVLDADDNSLVFLRDMSKAPDAGCAAGNKSDRVLVALHRGKAQNRWVPTDDTWALGCKLDHPELASSGSSATVSGDEMWLQLQEDSVFIASCR
ncbi:MAG: alpha-amylase family glycosyl hydrolase [Acidobacteriaceae bacterium]|nr:alpha-amylase family glycosyl hydrolase [Acidobacteriaceae bacterium]